MEKHFSGSVNKFEEGLWSYYILVPEKVYQAFKSEKIKRIVVTINAFTPPIHAGFMPIGDGSYFIKLNKDLIKEYQLKLGDKVHVVIEEDTSKYGMPITTEMEEVLHNDPEGSKLFHTLTPGKIRQLIFLVNKVKSSEARIEKSIIILEFLKRNTGKLDWKMLHENLKSGL